MKIASFVARCTIAALVLALAQSPTLACCGVSSFGRGVAFGDQNNIVVWDAATSTEHFVRNANFLSDAENFGFIAPTPSKPELSEADPKAFNLLGGLKPRSDFAFGAVAASKSLSVQVVQQVHVGGYDATTLLASDAKALAAWMTHNGYGTTPGIEKWTKFYISKGWFLTAFKVANPDDVIASTGTIRMSFRTTQPFNPYYVPADNRPKTPGTLRLFFVSSGVYEGKIGANSPWIKSDWQADLPEDEAATLAGRLHLSASAIPKNSRVESYTDSNFAQGAEDDLYFSPTPPNYAAMAFVPSIVLLLGLLYVGVMRLKELRFGPSKLAM